MRVEKQSPNWKTQPPWTRNWPNWPAGKQPRKLPEKTVRKFAQRKRTMTRAKGNMKGRRTDGHWTHERTTNGERATQSPQSSVEGCPCKRICRAVTSRNKPPDLPPKAGLSKRRRQNGRNEAREKSPTFSKKKETSPWSGTKRKREGKGIKLLTKQNEPKRSVKPRDS